MKRCDLCGGEIPLEAKGLGLRPHSRTLTFGDKSVRLQPKGLSVLEMLMAADGEYVPHHAIVEALFPQRIGKNVEVHIHRLRAALRELTPRVEIGSEWGKGYRLCGPNIISEGEKHVQ